MAHLTTPDTRDRLIAAARTVIGRSGLRDARMEDIAAEAGVSRAGVYYHFNSKADLAAALVDDILQGVVAAVRSTLADGSIEEVIRATARFFGHQVAVARLLITEMPTPVDPEHIIGRHRDELLALLRRRLEMDMRAGRVRQCDAGVAAAALEGLLRVTTIEMIAGRRGDLEHFVDELCGFVHHALSPHTTPPRSQPDHAGPEGR